MTLYLDTLIFAIKTTGQAKDRDGNEKKISNLIRQQKFAEIKEIIVPFINSGIKTINMEENKVRNKKQEIFELLSADISIKLLILGLSLLSNSFKIEKNV